MKNPKVAFLGGGMMAEAIIKGVLKSKLFAPGDISVVEISKNRCSYLKEKYGIVVAEKSSNALKNVDALVIAVKPQMLASALDQQTVMAVEQETLVISIAAGITIAELQHFFGGQQPILRVMPNTPLAVGEGMSVVAKGENAGDAGVELATKIFACCGQVLELPESQLDAVTGLSGSGPGYLFVIIDALADAGVAAGLTRDNAIKLAAQTVLGSGKMVLETGLHPAQLRDQVTSPGGTTIAGIAAMEKAGVRAGMMEAVWASMEKSRSFKKNG